LPDCSAALKDSILPGIPNPVSVTVGVAGPLRRDCISCLSFSKFARAASEIARSPTPYKSSSASILEITVSNCLRKESFCALASAGSTAP